jgi:uncharacterized protein YukE
MDAHREDKQNHNSRHSTAFSATSTEDHQANDLQRVLENQDASLELLRELIFGEYRQQVTRMRAEVNELQSLLDGLEEQINDKQALVATITPVIADAIRSNIRDSQSEMIDALYPIMGKLVQRSVTEAMRDLAQRIDHQMRKTFNFKDTIKRMTARLRGVSDAEMTLRNALPFQVLELFLIHRESGLLLLHASTTPEDAADSDLISSMLTAIRDFTQDAFGRSDTEELNQIQYGGKGILLEVAHLVYIAAVVDGIEPRNFREHLRGTMIMIAHQHAEILQNYDGNAAIFASAQVVLTDLLAYGEEDG